MEIVRTENLTRAFGSMVAVDQVNLAVQKGEIFGIVGPDGAGKTTTLRMLCGLIEPTSGRAVVSGFDVAKQGTEVKDRIGYMAQRFGLYLGLTVQENMDFYADLFGISSEERASLGQRLLEMTRMEPFRDRLASNLSGGMKQKLGLMCSLLHRPEILFLDEPTNGVDPVSRRDFWAILYELVSGGLTVVVTTAYLDEAERCNRVALMQQGRIVTVEEPARLKGSIKETCYEIRTADNRKARLVLENLEGVQSVSPAGDALHAFAGAEMTADRLRTSLEVRGCAVHHLAAIAPSMEDVFIALVSKGERTSERESSEPRAK